MAADGTTTCPPHYWQVTSREVDRTVYDHHRCQRCGLEKDTIRAPLSTQAGWGASNKGGARPNAPVVKAS